MNGDIKQGSGRGTARSKLESVRVAHTNAPNSSWQNAEPPPTARPRRNLCYPSGMPRARCLWCTDSPFEETAVLKWRGEERERLTVWLCRKHLSRLRESGARGKETGGWNYKVGWW